MKTYLPHRTWLAISGPDAERFLQGQLTCDMREVNAGLSPLAAHCSPQGRVISLFRLIKHGNTYYLNLPLDMKEIAEKNFRKYIPFFKASLNDVSDTLQAVGVDAAEYATLDTQGLTIAKVDDTRYIIIGDALSDVTHNETAWHAQDIQAGLPMVYAATSEKFLPHYLNLPVLGGVSFQKGCYTGQEIIARMQYQGKLKYALQQKILHHAASVGEKLSTGETVVDGILHHDQWQTLVIGGI